MGQQIIKNVQSRVNRSTMYRILKQLSLLLLVGILCSFWPFSRGSSNINLKITTTEMTNDGTPFYVYIKEVEKGEFLKSEYQQIVREAFPFTDVGPGIHPEVLLPGKNYRIKINREHPEKLLGIYFLFTNPGDDWKLLSDASKKIDVVLGETEIISTKSK